jgi:hypothetical protein
MNVLGTLSRWCEAGIALMWSTTAAMDVIHNSTAVVHLTCLQTKAIKKSSSKLLSNNIQIASWHFFDNDRAAEPLHNDWAAMPLNKNDWATEPLNKDWVAEPLNNDWAAVPLNNSNDWATEPLKRMTEWQNRWTDAAAQVKHTWQSWQAAHIQIWPGDTLLLLLPSSWLCPATSFEQPLYHTTSFQQVVWNLAVWTETRLGSLVVVCCFVFLWSLDLAAAQEMFRMNPAKLSNLMLLFTQSPAQPSDELLFEDTIMAGVAVWQGLPSIQVIIPYPCNTPHEKQ